MASANGAGSGTRCHIVLVPGFGGFDALGRVEYYSGTTRLFQEWNRKYGPFPVVLHYFDNLPTAAVVTRAARLRSYLAKRIARGEILEDDRIILVGHSTGGLDIRQTISDLHDARNRRVYVDGGLSVSASAIRRLVDGVVFLSVPHCGTNIADWVLSHAALRKTVIAELRAAVAGSQVAGLDHVESGLAGVGAWLTGADLLLAARDALTEANERLAGPDRTRVAGALEAASELDLYFRMMASDFAVIEDLASDPERGKTSPAHFNDSERDAELEFWKRPAPIRTLSFATVGGRAFRFMTPSGCPAPEFRLSDPTAYLAIAASAVAGGDLSYGLCYRACAGGPLQWPGRMGKIGRVLGPAPPAPLELWDNDGIVNTVSMLWPGCESVLVTADHLDIVGHFERRVAQHQKNGSERPRIYETYDSLKSEPRFTAKAFEDVWTEIFFFAAAPAALRQNRRSEAMPVRLAAPAAAAAAAG